MANVAVAEACPVDIDVFAKSDHFKKFAHFVLMYQFLYCGGCLDVFNWIRTADLRQQISDAEIEQEIRLGAGSRLSPTCFRAGACNIGEIDVRSQIGQADIEKWVVDSVMAIVAE